MADLVIIIHADKRPPRALVQGRSIGFKTGDLYSGFLGALTAKDIPVVHWKMGESTKGVAQFDMVSAKFGDGVLKQILAAVKRLVSRFGA